MKNDSFMYFSCGENFFSFFNQFDIYNGWKIQSGKMNDRGKAVKDRTYFRELVNLFNEKNLFYKRLSIAETVSFLDNYCIMKRLLRLLRLKLGKETYQQIEIFWEYEIRMSKRMRVDFILKYKDKMLLLEFRLVNSFEKLRPTWQRKKQELLIYKELMNNYIPRNKIMLSYAFIFLYEYRNNKRINKHIEYNTNQVNYLLKYIGMYLIYDLDYSF